MNAHTGKRGRPAGSTGLQAGSRKAQILALKPGESVIFTGKPGQSVSRLMASIASCFRGGESIGGLGLTQSGGLCVFEGELPLAAVKVTRKEAAQ